MAATIIITRWRTKEREQEGNCKRVASFAYIYVIKEISLPFSLFIPLLLFRRNNFETSYGRQQIPVLIRGELSSLVLSFTIRS